MAPKVCYARSGDVHIAYAVLGDGPIDVVFVPGFVSKRQQLPGSRAQPGLGGMVRAHVALRARDRLR